MNRKLFPLSLVLLFVAGCLNGHAAPKLNDLQIQVVLAPNGDAVITETRYMDIDLEGTECYIVVGNLNGSEVRDLQVSDEKGNEFKNIGEWDVDRTRIEKSYQCGIVTKSSGYELCWGLGDTGSRVYTTTYTVTNLLRAYSDADGFNYMFVAENLSPRPDHVRVTIVPAVSAADSLAAANGKGVWLNVENTGVWAFRYRGDIHVENGSIVAETSEPFSSGSALIVMARFDKGLFDPALTESGSFEQVRERAFENSDYLDDGGSGGGGKGDFFLTLLILFIFLMPPILIGVYIYYVWKSRKKVQKDLLWYRDIPANGNLQWGNDVINAYKYFSPDYNNLLSASVLKLMNLGAIGIETGMDRKGKVVQQFVIHTLKDADRQPNLLRQIHKIFLLAAGDDTILEPKELKKWMKRSENQEQTDEFLQALHTKRSISDLKDQLDEVRQLFGLKKFLKEFSLIDERHVQEVSLWKDYMIYAALFGIADQVVKDMKNINPEFFKMDQVAQQMADDLTLPAIQTAFLSGTNKAAKLKEQREARASGRGGSSSWSGGGGFSGGGSGGGVR